VDVRVRNIVSGQEATLTDGYRYTQPIQLTAISNNQQRVDLPFTPVTIFGHGFQSPVAVTLAGRAATIISVSESELVVLPSRPALEGCTDESGAVSVTNINTGDTASGLTFIYLVAQTTPVIVSISPRTGTPGTVVTITGFNLPISIADAQVEFGGRLAVVTSASSTELVVIAPDQFQLPPVCLPGTSAGTLTNVGTAVDIVVTNRLTTCSATSTGAFQYQLPCAVPTPTTPVVTPTTTPTPTQTPVPGADLSVAKTDTPDPVTSGGNVTYTVVVTNNGPATAASVNLTDTLPNGTTFVSCSASLGTCSGNPGTNDPVTASLGDIGPSGAVTVTIEATVTAGAGTVISNTATATSSTPDPTPANNTGTAATTVGP
jgi:uncharacterized repeat protein (TIGR01451 family)